MPNDCHGCKGRSQLKNELIKIRCYQKGQTQLQNQMKNNLLRLLAPKQTKVSSNLEDEKLHHTSPLARLGKDDQDEDCNLADGEEEHNQF